jgi:hypothetical protein
MTVFRRRRVPGAARGRREVAGFRHLAAVELPGAVVVDHTDGDVDFWSHDEDVELLLADKDRRLLQAQELRRSQRLRARRRSLEARVAAAKALLARRQENFDAARRRLEAARSALTPVAFRRLSTRGYLRRKIVFALGETVSLAVAFSAAFDVPPLQGLLLSAGIALAFVVAGDLGGILRHALDGAHLATVELDPQFAHLGVTGERRWLRAAWGGAAAVFAVAAVAVGTLRAGAGAGVPLAAAMAVLTLVLALGSGISSWQHANLAADLLDHLERTEDDAADACARAARARVLSRYDALGERIDTRWRATEELAAARLRSAQALCSFFRARHPKVFGHGVRRRLAHADRVAPPVRAAWPVSANGTARTRS